MEDALKIYATKSALAEALGIERSAVSQWGEKIPKFRQFQLQVLTGGFLLADPEHQFKAPPELLRRPR